MIVTMTLFTIAENLTTINDVNFTLDANCILIYRIVKNDIKKIPF